MSMLEATFRIRFRNTIPPRSASCHTAAPGAAVIPAGGRGPAADAGAPPKPGGQPYAGGSSARPAAAPASREPGAARPLLAAVGRRGLRLRLRRMRRLRLVLAAGLVHGL